MKRILSGLIAALSLLPSLAPAEVVADNYPVNFAKCGYIVTEPPGSGHYLHSADCKTVYVLPSRMGILKTNVSLNETVLKSICPTMENYIYTFEQDSKHLRNTQDRLNVLEATGGNEKEIKRFKEIAERMHAKLNAIKDPFRHVDGGKASFTMHADTTRALVQDFYRDNQNLVYSRQVKFEPMPIQIGYLSLTNYRPLNTTLFPSSLAIHMNLPAVVGRSPDSEVKAEGEEQNLYKMRSSASGQIVLGTAKACDMYKKKLESAKLNREITPDQLGKELITEIAPTFSYSYPVMSTIRYDAFIKTTRAVKLLLDTGKVNGQFHVSDFAKMLGEGTTSDIFEMTIDLADLGNRFTNEADRQMFLTKFINEVRERLAVKFLRELEVVGLVKFGRDVPLQPPAPGYITEPAGTVRTCSSSSLLGVTYNRSCLDRAVTRTIPIAGTSQEIIDRVQNFKIKVEERVKIKELILHGNNVVFE